MPATSAPAIITGIELGGHHDEEGEAAQDVGDDGAGAPADAVDQRAEQRPEDDRREQLGEQDGGDGPGRVEAVVGEQRQGDTASPLPRHDCACAAKKRRAGAWASAARNIRRWRSGRLRSGSGGA